MIPYSMWRETKSFELERAAFDQLNKLFYELNELRQKDSMTAGDEYQKFAVFHYISRTEHLLTVIGAILRRMESDKIDYARVLKEESARIQQAFKTNQQIVISADESSDRYREFLMADFESLYQIGNMLLDQWALVVTHLAGLSKPREFNFQKLIRDVINRSDHPNALALELRNRYIKEIRWIYHHLLIFRDKFVVHQNKPFQQSTLTDSVRGDIRICYLVDPVWYGEPARRLLEERIWKLNDQAPDAIKLAKSEISNPSYVLSHMFLYFEDFNEEQQNELGVLAKENGFSTPSSLELAHRLFRMVQDTTNVIRVYAQRPEAMIKLGSKEH